MKQKPILFNTDMVRAIQAGRKTVTRRVVKPQPRGHAALLTGNLLPETAEAGVGAVYAFEDGTVTSPPYRPGDILYVRETWSTDINGDYVYRTNYGTTEDDSFPPNAFKWRPSIHMPREAARIFLRVTGVRTERLQGITAEQVLDEGVEVKFPEPKPGYISYAYTEMRLKPAARKQFADLWDSTIKHIDRAIYGWDANPWVWAIEFERCEKPKEGQQ